MILYENELKEVEPRMLQGLKSFKMLDIGNNYISIIPAGLLAEQVTLDLLWLSGNNLVTLNDNIFMNESG